MKFKSQGILAISLSAIILVSCNNTTNNESNETAVKQSAETTTEAPAFKNQEGVLQLNGSEKWEANTETTKGIENMIEQVQGFRGLNVQDDLASYNLLARGVKNTMDEIFNKCTMKGAAHDELHDFLLPILGMQKKLAGSDIKIAKETLDKLEAHLAEYANYFE